MVRQIVIDKSAAGKSKPRPVAQQNPALTIPCRHRGQDTRQVSCKACRGTVSLKVFACPLHGECTIAKPFEGLATCTKCPDYDPCAVIAPTQSMNGTPMWQGVSSPKPWQYQVTAVIPHLDTPDELALVVELLQLQTVKPYIVIIDTGSTLPNLAKVEALRSWSVEVHSLRFNALRHSSDFPAIAMDLGMSACQTEWMFCTHADVFPRRSDLIESLLNEVEWNKPGDSDVLVRLRAAVGYRMSPRNHPDWERMVSHTATLLHMPTMYRIGAGWNLRRCCEVYGESFGGYAGYENPRRGVKDKRHHLYDNWPDTELLLNYILWDHGLTPENGGVKLIGTEENMQRTVDDNIDHCRSLTVARLYSSNEYAAKADAWARDAMEAGRARADEWRNSVPSVPKVAEVPG